MNENKISTVYRACIDALQNNPSQDVQQLIAMVSLINNFNLSLQEIDTVQGDIQRFFSTKQNKAHVLEDRDERIEPWIHKFKNNEYYHNRYLRYLKEKAGFSQRSIQTIDQTNRDVLNRLGNPSDNQSFKRQGLVVGNVQSGKTANYLSLINLAADYGYKIIILIAGVHNNLRTQTQERVNEGFIGIDTDTKSYVGVGALTLDSEEQELTSKMRPYFLTNRSSDFSKHILKSTPVMPDNSERPIIMVIKKNTSTLENVLNWLRNEEEGQRFIKHPALIIDDEADNASINTKKNPEETTTINRKIREIFNLFNKGSYIGFTATPFANIFIDPDIYDEKTLAEDLFPRHFIFSLEAPSNYIGANEFFLNEEGQINYDSQLIELIEDNDDTLPVKRPADFIPTDLPKSLTLAIYDFLVSIVIKKIRPIKNPHTSMLINVSHKTEFQREVKNLITLEMNRINRSVQFKGLQPLDIKLNDEHIKGIYSKYQEFADEINEVDFFRELQNACSNISVKLINSNSKDRLNYSEYPDGLNVIAVGGYSLSRGFTLEGLTVSYLIRNTAMSDTLLQMGRWFGYRDNYKDLCKLYIIQKSFEWYAFIAQSLNELKNEFIIMERNRLTPMEYGLRVRTSKAGLLVTARNKMYHTKNLLLSENLSSNQFSLNSLSTNQLDKQYEIYSELIKKLNLEPAYVHKKEVNSDEFKIAKNVNLEIVKTFLNQHVYADLDLDQQGKVGRKSMLINYIEQRKGELSKWDILVASSYLDSTETNQSRAFSKAMFKEDYLEIMDGGGRITRPWEESFGLSTEEYKKSEQEREKDNIYQTARFYRQNRKKPLLVLKLFDIYSLVKDDNGKKQQELIYHNVPAFSISFPKSSDESLVSYTCNAIYLEKLLGEDDSDEDEQD